MDALQSAEKGKQEQYVDELAGPDDSQQEAE